MNLFLEIKLKTFFEKYLKLTFFKEVFRKMSICFGKKLFLENKLICILKK
jgi:hypothetical protein